MECKCRSAHENAEQKSELIDTLWNVNSQFLVLSLKFVDELIDTLWNVNTLRE